MFENLSSGSYLPFSIAGGVMLGVLLLEIAFMLAGKPLSALLDHLGGHDAAGPEVPPSDTTADAPQAPAHGKFEGAFAWLNAGRVPGLILLILALAWFAASGFAIQGIATELFRPLPGWIASIAALLPSVPLLRISTVAVARLLPQDETYAASHGDFLGMTGMVVLGPVRQGAVAKARFRDLHGNVHFPRVEPYDPEEVIEQGEPVLAVEARGQTIAVTRAKPSLTGRIA